MYAKISKELIMRICTDSSECNNGLTSSES